MLKSIAIDQIDNTNALNSLSMSLEGAKNNPSISSQT
jgi:hypothetical protein